MLSQIFNLQNFDFPHSVVAPEAAVLAPILQQLGTLEKWLSL
jgi:hypothetical protein